MGCKYVKEFDFGTKGKDGSVKYSMGGKVGGYAKGGACKGYAEGGKVHSDVAMDKKMVKEAVHKHEKALHKGEPMTKLAKGGKVPRVEAMGKREMAMTPTMRREAAMTSRKVEAPARKMVPVASREPMLAMKKGGKAYKS